MFYSKVVRRIMKLTVISLTVTLTIFISETAFSLDTDDWYLIRVKHTNFCLNILGLSQENGAPATQGNRCDTSNFMWRFIPITEPTPYQSNSYKIAVRHSNQCLNVLGGSYENGAPVVQGKRCDMQTSNGG